MMKRERKKNKKEQRWENEFLNFFPNNFKSKFFFFCWKCDKITMNLRNLLQNFKLNSTILSFSSSLYRSIDL